MNVQRASEGSLVVDVSSEGETDALGRALAISLQPGMVVGLDGPLGAGKTRLVRAITQALDAGPIWAGSPTFTLIQEYDGPLPLYHVDVYRLSSVEEFQALGGEDYLSGDGVCLIEWASRIAELLPDTMWQVQIEVTSPASRRFTISSRSAWSRSLLQQVASQLHPEA